MSRVPADLRQLVDVALAVLEPGGLRDSEVGQSADHPDFAEVVLLERDAAPAEIGHDRANRYQPPRGSSCSGTRPSRSSYHWRARPMSLAAALALIGNRLNVVMRSPAL
jgi:hypothetical protein